jgi:hypothetical protein
VTDKKSRINQLLHRKHSKTNPTFFEALEEWERPAKRETKKEQLERYTRTRHTHDTSRTTDPTSLFVSGLRRLQGCYGEWVYGTTDAPEVPLEKPAGRAAARRK